MSSLTSFDPALREVIYKLPKAELHCHLDGSLRVDTLFELAKEKKVKIPYKNKEELMAFLYFEKGESLEVYLSKFDLTLSVLQTPDALERVAYELAEDASKENIKWLEVRYSPILHTNNGMGTVENLESVIHGLKRAELDFGIQGGVIICGMRNISPEVSYNLAELAVAYKNRGVVGFDLAGPEENYPAKDHENAFRLVLKNNINITIHAGEAYGPESIHQAVHYCGAHRIGHGTRLAEDGDLLNYINDHRICLEICLTSNVQTGAVKSLENHPFKYFKDYGLRLCLNTDNRLISNTTLTNELCLAYQTFNLKLKDIKDVLIDGFKSSFMHHRDRVRLIRQISVEIDELIQEYESTTSILKKSNL
ncbi:MAG: adenosine deaminase [Candidatus Marinimicrobia bacterium]|nr:adenosine deaminase [Candidatus Neomarinimicrobiota bacterium]